MFNPDYMWIVHLFYSFQQRNQAQDHYYTAPKAQRTLVQDTIKFNCPATITLREVMKFPNYKVNSCIFIENNDFYINNDTVIVNVTINCILLIIMYIVIG